MTTYLQTSAANPAPAAPRLSAAIPWRSLLVLVVAVLLAHLLLLSSPAKVWNIAQRASTTGSMNTRTLDAAPAPVAAPATAPAVVPPTAPVQPPPTPVAKAPKKEAKPPVAQQNIAQAAIENGVTEQPKVAQNDAPIAPTTIDEATRTQPDMTATETASAETTTTAIAASENTSATPSAAVSDNPSSDSLAQIKLKTDAFSKPGRALTMQFPSSGKLDYNVAVQRGAQPQTGSGTLDWTTDGSQYQVRLVSTAFFLPLLSQTSLGKLSADGLQPERFSDKRFNRSEKAAHFQHDKALITFSGNQNQAPLLRGAQDQLSVLVQLAAMFAGSPKQLNELGSVSIQVASTDDAETWVFLIGEREQIQVPAGETMALHLVRNPRKEFDTRLEVWLAPSLGYMPVRIKQTNANGNSDDLQLRSPSVKMPVPP